jgi:hypothetical protein
MNGGQEDMSHYNNECILIAQQLESIRVLLSGAL